MTRALDWSDVLIKRFWNYYSNYPELYFTYQYGNNIVNQFSDHFNSNCKILDYGCGTGFLIEHLLKHPVDVFGTDVSEDTVEFVNKKYNTIENFKGAFLLNELIQTETKFDILFVVEVIEHLTEEHLVQLIKNIKHLLNANGKVIFTTPNNEKLADSIVYCPNCEHTFHRWQHIRSWTSESLSSFLNENGMNVSFSKSLNFTIPTQRTIKAKLRSLLNRGSNLSKNPHLAAVCSKG